MSSLREAVFRHATRRYLDCDIEGLGIVRIQSITERERAECELKSETDKTNFLLWLITFAVVDQHGNREFGPDDIDQLAKVDSKVIQKLSGMIQQHCFGEIEDDEEAVKN